MGRTVASARQTKLKKGDDGKKSKRRALSDASNRQNYNNGTDKIKGPEEDGGNADQETAHYVYKCFVVFVDDPKLKSPFTVLKGSDIRRIEEKTYVNNRFLNDKRRRHRYDIAFTNRFTYPCRVFAKAENSISPVKLHLICDGLNQQFKVLMACKVSVETAYTRLLEANPRKIKDGVTYETGEADPASQLPPLPDTASSFSEGNEPVDDRQSAVSGSFGANDRKSGDGGSDSGAGEQSDGDDGGSNGGDRESVANDHAGYVEKPKEPYVEESNGDDNKVRTCIYYINTSRCS